MFHQTGFIYGFIFKMCLQAELSFQLIGLKVFTQSNSFSLYIFDLESQTHHITPGETFEPHLVLNEQAETSTEVVCIFPQNVHPN